MKRTLTAIIALLGVVSGYAQNTFSPRQRAWLYRVAAQTSTIQNNCGNCFQTNSERFTNYGPNGKRINYNLAEEILTQYPDSLSIDFSCLQEQSHGVLAELAVKTTIWELARTLKNAINNLPSSTDSVFGKLSSRIIKKMPKKEQSKPQSKRTLMTLAVVMHPSLPFTIKREKLTQLKYSPLEQKEMLEEWTRISANWTMERSRYYFDALAGTNAFYALKMLAAGDGSGTSGLLYEYEPHPTDSTRNGYGVGIGLFTYRYATKSEAVVPLPQTSTSIALPDMDTVSVHCSVFGLDSSRKPMIVFTLGDKSYHLFSGLGALTPNPIAEDGISHIDRIRQATEARINKPMQSLDKDGGLNDIYEREVKQKEAMEASLRALESEIDSLQKETPVNQTAIDVRKRQINTLLTNLTAKERRVAELSRKLSEAYKKIDQSRHLVTEMENLLGPNPQSYTQDGNIYTFADGSLYDQSTQDFLLARDNHPNELSIRLIPASLTMVGQSKDEVQLFVNTTNAVRRKAAEQPKPLATVIDTVLRFHYAPDVYQLSPDSHIVADIAQMAKHFAVVQIMPTIVEMKDEPQIRQKYASIKREMAMPLTENGQLRQTELHIKSVGDTLQITITASTDNVPTRLSQLTEYQRETLGIDKPQWKNNQWLAWLRGAWMAQQIQQLIPQNATIEISNQHIEIWNTIQKIGAPQIIKNRDN